MERRHKIIGLLLLAFCMHPVAAAPHEPQPKAESQDTTDVFTRHLQLQEIIVTGLTGESRLSETPSPVAVVDARSLHGTASTNIISALASQGGVSQISTGAGIGKPVIRGLGYNRVVVIADGIRQEGQQWGDEHGIEIDGAGVHSAEIIKGPASLMYGSDALAGVIIFHGDPNPAPGSLVGGITSEYQTNSGLAAYSLYHAGNSDGLVWDLRFSDKYAHAYRNAADGFIPGTQFRERAFSAKAGLNRDWGFSRLTVGYYHLTPGMIEGEEEDEAGASAGAAYAITSPYQQVRHYKAVWDNTIRAGEGRIKALLGWQQNRRQEYEESDEAELDFRLNTLNYELKYLLESGGWKFASGAGGMLQASENLGEEVLIPAYRLADGGIFATASRTLGKFHLSGGIRGDIRSLHSFGMDGKFSEFNRDFTGITGSLGAVFAPTEHLNLRANLARGFRAPNLSELASNGVHEGTLRYELGSRDLRPEYSLQADLGADYARGPLSATFALFASRIDGYIYSARTGAVSDGFPVYGYTSGRAVLYGGEAGIDWHPVHRLHLSLLGDYVRGTFDAGDLPLIPAPRVRAEVKVELFHEAGPFTDGYVSCRVDRHFAQNHFLEGTETPAAAYTLAGVSAGSDITVRGRCVCTLTLLADNLFDTVYSDHLSRLKDMGLHGPGRNFSVKLEIPLAFRNLAQ